MADCRPRAFFSWFEQITRIPRGSGQEERIGQFILDYAERRGLSAQRDEIGNVFVRVPAFPGYETEPTLLIQSHLDMVWNKDPDVEFDFSTQAIQLQIKDGAVCGRGTTLGADNGIGIAFMMALMEDPEIVHPPLELLFTVQEEVGLVGIQNFDLSKVTARRMINTDCGYSHGMCVSSVGTVKYRVSGTFSQEKLNSWSVLCLRVKNGRGGHGGLDIHRGRICAVNLSGELLHRLKKEIPLRLVKIQALGAAIHGWSDVTFAVPADRATQAQQIIMEHWEGCRERYLTADPETIVEVCRGTGEAAVSEDDSARMVDMMFLLPTAALRHDGADTSFVLTSHAIAATSLEDGIFSLDASVRSVFNSERDREYERISVVVAAMGFDLTRKGGYNSWPTRLDSVVQQKMRMAHRALFGREIEVEHIHGGIEVSYVMQVYPDMDVLGISPTAKGCHTPQERLFIDEVQPYWDLMMEFLRMKDEKIITEENNA